MTEQKILKLNYLTEQEFKSLYSEQIDLQIALGLKSCKTLKDVTELLHDVREHQKYLFKEWLIRKRQEREGNDFSKERFQTLAFYDNLLEELK
jgi:hypothetical protein